MTSLDCATAVRPIETRDEFVETRLEAVGFVFVGNSASSNGGKVSGRSGANVLHFARCAKLDQSGATRSMLWFRSIRVAKAHLDETVGADRWKWCKSCQKEITQRILNEP